VKAGDSLDLAAFQRAKPVAVALWGRNECSHCKVAAKEDVNVADGYGFLMDEQVWRLT
jgi:hypothetical protein